MKEVIKTFAIGADVSSGSGDKIGTGDPTLTNDVTTIISSVIGILALVCVIIVIIGGVNYMTSTGDAGKVKKAKDTILYGIIGLIICALAFAIVNWVIGALLK